MTDHILVDRDGAIATVVLNRPEKLNALTKAMWQALGEAIDALSADDALRCVIVRGAGEKAFSPGNDIAEFAVERGNRAQAIAYGRVMHATGEAFLRCRHPLVAQIHGICVGGGLEIAALCDLRICGESSRFGVPIKNLGLVMAYPRNGAAGAPRRRRRRARDPARRAASSAPPKRRTSASSRASFRMPRSPRRRGRRRSASPTARRWSPAGTRSSPAASPKGGRSRTTNTTSASRASTPRTSGPATPRSSPRPRPSSAASERDRAPALRPARGHARARARADHGRADLRHDAGRPGRRRDQDREAAGRRRFARLSRAARQRHLGAVPDDEPQQARHGAQSQGPARTRDPAAHGARRRRPHRKLPPRHHGKAGARLRHARAGEPGAHLLPDFRVRPHRAARGPGRLRSHCARLCRADGADRRAGTAAGQDRQSGRRHRRRHPRGRGSRRRVCAQAEDRPRPARRHVAVRGCAAADLLACGDPLCDR